MNLRLKTVVIEAKCSDRFTMTLIGDEPDKIVGVTDEYPPKCLGDPHRDCIRLSIDASTGTILGWFYIKQELENMLIERRKEIEEDFE